VIPLEGLDAALRRIQPQDVFHPPMTGAAQNERVVVVTQSCIIAGVGIDAQFFVTGSDDQSSITPLT